MTAAHAGLFGPQSIRMASGRLAKNFPVDVFLPGTTTRAPLYSNQNRSAAVSNPVFTDSQGNLEFYANPGVYNLRFGSFTIQAEVEVNPIDDVGSGSEVRFDYHQIAPAATWIIEHNLGKYPNWVVFLDEEPGVVTLPDITHVSETLTSMEFPSPVSGSAHA
jgi:hypothetical protein